MALREEDVARIGEYVKPWLREYVAQMNPIGPSSIGTQLLERMVRVEEELRLQRGLMDERFRASDQRFETLQTAMDQRFEAVDKRFETLQTAMDQRFKMMQTAMDQRFEAVDRRFETQQTAMEDRFEAVDKRFDDVQPSIGRMQWLIGIGFLMITTAVAVFGMLG